MKTRDFLAKNIFYPLHNIARVKIIKLVGACQKWQYFPEEQINKMQIEQLKKLLIYSYRFVPYYKYLFKKIKFDPFKFSNFKDLEAIPFLTKEVVLNNLDKLKNDKAPGLHINSSGGSTGCPLNFYQDANYFNYEVATTFISDMMAGWSFGNRVVRLWGAPQDFNKGKKLKILYYLLNQDWLDAFNLSLKKFYQYHQKLSLLQPDHIIAYASSIFLLARYLKEHKINPNYPRKSIVSSAEVLTKEMRETIEGVFGVPVYDRYGSREVGIMGSECEKHEGLHFHPYHQYIECLDIKTKKPVVEKVGEFFVTSLTNFGMPFIRYQIGDLGIIKKQQCSCGRTTKLFKKIIGRRSDTIVTRSGKLIHGEYFTHIFYKIKGVKQFQFLQKNLDNFQLLLVKDKNLKQSTLNQVKDEINEIIEGAKLEIKFVKKIPPTQSGKYCFTASKVQLEEMIKNNAKN